MRRIAQLFTNHDRQVTPQAGPGSHSPMRTSDSCPAIARLAEDAALLAQIMTDRPALVAAALLGGTTVIEIATVLGWELTELQMAVRRWAPQLQKAGQLTESQCTALLDDVFELASQWPSPKLRGPTRSPES